MRETKRPETIRFVELYEAILTDYLTVYPTDRLEVMRDNKRIALELRSRGLSFLTIDLPDMGKVLDQSLAKGRLLDHRVPCFGARWKRSNIPKLFSGLWIRLFERSGQLREDIDPNVILFLRTLLYTCKKLNLECKPKRVYDAVKEYYDVDLNLPPPISENWSRLSDSSATREYVTLADAVAPGMGRSANSEGQTSEFHDASRSGPEPGRVGGDEILAHIQRTAGRIVSSFGLFDPYELRCKHGPGAVSEGLAWKTKYVFPSWSPRLESFFPWDYHGVTTVDNFLENGIPIPGLLPSEEESASKLAAVPKTQKGPRLIAAEPVCNQWIQQGLADVLRERVGASTLGLCIDFFDQNPSREAALDASRHGRRSTIDLSSASDRLSCRLVEAVFRSNKSLLVLMSACRTRFLANPIDKRSPKLIELRKYASMGSALTFPVQSIVFAILAIGVGSFLTGRRDLRKLAKEVRVFGDDIILPNSWVDTYVGVLHRLGLKVNLSKTFTEGNFRESCGMDAYAGSDVTPAYVRWPSPGLFSRSAIGYVAVTNNFFLKGFWHTAAYLESAASWMRKLPAVNFRAAALGKASFCKGIDPGLKLSWDKDTQQDGVYLFRVKRRPGRPYQVTNPNGMMEYSVRNRGTDYSWKNLFSNREGWLPLSSFLDLPPDGSAAVIRRGWIPSAVLSTAE